MVKYYVVCFSENLTYSEAREKAKARIVDARNPPIRYIGRGGSMQSSALAAKEFTLSEAKKECKDYNDNPYLKGLKFAVIDEQYKMIR